MTVKYNILWT